MFRLRNMSENTRGAILMILAMAAFTINDSFMKAVLVKVPLMQAITLRGTVNLVMGLLILPRFVGQFRFDLSRRDWALTILRGGAEALAAFTFLTAISRMTLANATAILQTLPLAITICGAVVFRDPLGWRRLTAIFFGFVGMLLIVQPGGSSFNANALWALASVGLVTIRDLSVRGLSKTVPTSTVTLVSILIVTLVSGLLSLTTEWVPLSRLQAMYLICAACFIFVGYIFSVAVMRVGDISFVAPFRYTALIWALAIGLFVFGEWPNALALLGAALIAATGIYTVWRDAKRRKASRGG